MRFTVTEGEMFGSGRGHHNGLCVAPSQWSYAPLAEDVVLRNHAASEVRETAGER
jgi:hypothetical protein